MKTPITVGQLRYILATIDAPDSAMVGVRIPCLPLHSIKFVCRVDARPITDDKPLIYVELRTEQSE